MYKKYEEAKQKKFFFFSLLTNARQKILAHNFSLTFNNLDEKVLA